MCHTVESDQNARHSETDSGCNNREAAKAKSDTFQFGSFPALAFKAAATIQHENEFVIPTL
jgi:hypothetical protein